VVRRDDDGDGLYLVVKTTTAIEVVEECGVCLAAPKIHIGNLKIAPNCVGWLFFFQELEVDTDVQWQRL
jgi:hypothetical protein